jgi:hypothetical protein
MKKVLKSTAVLALVVTFAGAAWAQQSARNEEFLDYSTRSLMGEEQARKLMAEIVPAKLWKIYPATKYVFISQVEGGVTSAGNCAVTARVMLMPLSPTAKAVLFRPRTVATAFDALPNASADQCKAAAAVKLKEATRAVVSVLVKD